MVTIKNKTAIIIITPAIIENSTYPIRKPRNFSTILRNIEIIAANKMYRTGFNFLYILYFKILFDSQNHFARNVFIGSAFDSF